MKNAMIILFILTGILLTAQPRISRVNYYTSANYDETTGFEISRNIQIRNSGSATDFFVTISGGGSGDTNNRQVSGSGKSVSYYLYNDPTDKIIIKDLSSNPAPNEVLAGTFNSGNGTNNLKFYYTLPAGLFPPSGYFSDTVTISLYQGTLSNHTFIESVNIQFALMVDRSANLSVVPSGSEYNVNRTEETFDFGVLSPGQEKSADIIIRSNVNYSLELTSEKGGVLKRTDTWSNDVIPYTCFVNGVPVTLPEWSSVSIYSGLPSSTEGDRHSVRIVIGDFWNIADGPFGDRIRITLSAQ